MSKKWLPMIAGIMLITILAAGCTGKNTGGTSPSASPSPSASSETPQQTAEPETTPSASPDGSTAVSEEEQQAILDVFEALLKAPGNEKAALTEIGKDISKLSPENANLMLLGFEDYQNAALTDMSVLSDALIKMLETSKTPYNEEALNDPTQITDENLKTAVQAVLDRGYKIIVPEGMYNAIVDYSVYKTAEKYVTPDIAAYIELMAKESESRMLEDAAIIISMDEVFSRTLSAESFISTYHDSARYDQVEQKYQNYVTTYFYGQNNTPAFDYVTKQLDQKFLDSYQKAAESGKDSAIVKAVGEYLKVLETNDYKLTGAVDDYRKSMTNSLNNSAS